MKYEPLEYHSLSLDGQVTAELLAVDVIVALRGCTIRQAVEILHGPESDDSDALRREADALLACARFRCRERSREEGRAFERAMREYDERVGRG